MVNCAVTAALCLLFSGCGCVRRVELAELALADARRANLLVEIAPRRRRRELAWRRVEDIRGSVCVTQCKNRHGSIEGRHPRLPHVHRVAAALKQVIFNEDTVSATEVYDGAAELGSISPLYSLSSLQFPLNTPPPCPGTAAERAGRSAARRPSATRSASSRTRRGRGTRPRPARPRRNSGAGLLRRARRRAQPLVVEHDVERARPQRRRRHALRARPPLRLLPLGDAAQRPALFDEAPEQGRRPRPLRPPLRRVALRRRPPRLGAPRPFSPTQRPCSSLSPPAPFQSNSMRQSAQMHFARPPTALPSVGERRNLF